MKVKKRCLVTIEYRLTDDEGTEIGASTEDNPLQFVCGRGDVVPGLEKGVMGLFKGTSTRLTIQPDMAYGPHHPEFVKTLPKAAFPTHLPLEIGTRFSYRGDHGVEIMYRVADIGENTIIADYNHPLAGKVLHYDITILDVTKDYVDGK